MEESRMRSVRFSLVAFALLLASSPAWAGTQLGAIAGFNFASLNIDATSSLGVRSSFAVGGMIDQGITRRLGVRVEPMFLSKGAKTSQNNLYSATVDEAKFKLDYIDVPILARFDLAETPTRAYLLGGVGVSFATSLNGEFTQAGARETVDFTNVFSSTDVSADLGLGVGIPAGTGRMTFDGRVAFGLVNINNGGTVTYQGGPFTIPPTSTKTMDFRLFATYLFPLSH
jgi:hypothetical protein